jgi:hypothetical protein
MNLRKEISHYVSGEISSIKLLDKKMNWQGEYLSYNEDGSIYLKGFLKNNFCIGKFYNQDQYSFFSFIKPGNKISEQEHKKELAMIRLGLIEEPIEFSYFLKDYDENGKIK